MKIHEIKIDEAEFDKATEVSPIIIPVRKPTEYEAKYEVGDLVDFTFTSYDICHPSTPEIITGRSKNIYQIYKILEGYDYKIISEYCLLVLKEVEIKEKQ